MNVWLWIVFWWLVIDGLIVIGYVGKPRPTITPAVAVLNTIVIAGLCVAIIIGAML